MKLGLIGLGNMGSGMVKSLLAKGFSVIGFDTDDSRFNELIVLGIEKAANLDYIAKNCDVAIICLPSPEISRKVIFEQLLIVDDNHISTIIETSTLTPEIVIEFVASIKKKGKKFLSAPMIGGKNHASSGNIEFLVEGSEEVYSENRDIFKAMGSKARFMGEVPSATLAKLSFNLSRYANLAVGIEIYRLLKEYETNIPAIYEFMSEQSLDNFGQVWREDLNGMMTANVSYRPSQVPRKDLKLLAGMAKGKDLDEELIAAVLNTYLSLE